MTMIEIEGPNGAIEAWLAKAAPSDAQEPAAVEAAAPAVLLYMDAIGLRPQIWEMSERIASWGYTVLAPNIFYRSGSARGTSPQTNLRAPGERKAYFTEAGPRMESLTRDLSRTDTALYLETLRRLSGSDHIGVVGYCMGVRLAMRAAGDHAQTVKVLGGFHGGGLVTDAVDSPHLSLSTARAALLLRHADHDPSMSPEAMVVIERTCRNASVALSQEVYQDAPHGYSMADTSMYDEGAAERHFEELRTHLNMYLRSETAERGDQGW